MNAKFRMESREHVLLINKSKGHKLKAGRLVLSLP